MIDYPQTLVIYKMMQSVPVRNFKSFGSITDLWAKNLEKFTLHYMGKWAGGILLPSDMAAAMEMYEFPQL